MQNIGVRIIGPVNAPNEIGALVRGAAIGFSKLGIETSLGGIEQKGEPVAVYDSEYVNRLNILLSAKHTMPYVAIHINRAEAITFVEKDAIANIAWIAPSYDKIPFLQSILLQSMPLSEIWAPTKAQAQILKSSMTMKPNKVEVIPFGFDVDTFNPRAKKLEGVRKDGHFYFSAAGNLVPEYGLDLLLDAFYSEFSNDENVHLVWNPTLNMVKPEEKNKVASDILNKYKGRSKASVICFTEDQNDKFMASFLASSDCFVAPYRACGWGDDGLKALACGNRLITNVNTFNNYANHLNSISLPSSRNKIVDINWIMNNIIYQECSWHEINKTNLRQAMRDAYVNPIKKDLSSNISKEYDWSNVLMMAVTHIRKYGDKK